MADSPRPGSDRHLRSLPNKAFSLQSGAVLGSSRLVTFAPTLDALPSAGLESVGQTQVVASAYAGRLGEDPPHQVRLPVHRLKVLGTDAGAASAKVVEVESLGDGADEFDVDGPMGEPTAGCIASALPISVGPHGTHPQPTATKGFGRWSHHVDSAENPNGGLECRRLGVSRSHEPSVVRLAVATLEAPHRMVAVGRKA